MKRQKQASIIPVHHLLFPPAKPEWRIATLPEADEEILKFHQRGRTEHECSGQFILTSSLRQGLLPDFSATRCSAFLLREPRYSEKHMQKQPILRESHPCILPAY